jgi:hypothetical protein
MIKEPVHKFLLRKQINGYIIVLVIIIWLLETFTLLDWETISNVLALLILLPIILAGVVIFSRLIYNLMFYY